MSEKKVVRGIHVGKSAKSGRMRWAIMTLGPEGQTQWYSTFEPSIGRDVESLKENDVIDLNFYQKGDFLNIISVKKLEEAPAPATQDGPPDEPDEDKKGSYWKMKQTLIVAQNCLDRAVQLLPYTEPVIPEHGFNVNDLLAHIFLLADSLQEYIWKQTSDAEQDAGIEGAEITDGNKKPE